ncbi:MAG: hypothetical protein KJ600_04950 [Nanoarchaeota archaeon]|nr:hypothetical protein [Nanoarchaeota archaeon]MBU1103878.1 hypothetical protein [Nanoarchaeota archaeon]
MKIQRRNKKLETYGKVRDYRSRARVLLFSVVLIIFVVVLTIARGFLVPQAPQFLTGAVIAENVGNGKTNEEINYDFEKINFDIGVLRDDEVVKSLPKSAVVWFCLGESCFTLSKNSVTAGKIGSADVLIGLPLKYVGELGRGLCNALGKANSNGELGIETEKTNAYLAWKYKGMLKYRECLGY